jgi:hypothetical protein
MRHILLITAIILIVSVNVAPAADNLALQDGKANESDEAYKTGEKYYFGRDGVKYDFGPTIVLTAKR